MHGDILFYSIWNPPFFSSKLETWVISVWFLFFKIVFCSQKQKNHKEHVWFPIFIILKNTKNIENTKSREQEQFSREHQNGVLCVFTNCSQEHSFLSLLNLLPLPREQGNQGEPSLVPSFYRYEKHKEHRKN